MRRKSEWPNLLTIMKYAGSSAYDQDDFLKTYLQKRAKTDAPNTTLEKPIIDELIGEPKGLDLLDLGCGDGRYGQELLGRGARSYHGIDGSINMIMLARETLESHITQLDQVSLESFAYPEAAYDLVLSRLVFHYIEDMQPVLKGIYKSLKSGGALVFSIEHPILTCCDESYQQAGPRESWIVDNYFHSGERASQWLGKEVVKYHKTLEEYVQLLMEAGFRISQIRESKSHPSRFINPAQYERRMRIPLFLMFRVEKP